MRRITKVHMAGSGHGHEHIAEVVYEDGTTAYRASVSSMVTYLDGGGSAKVTDGRSMVDVGVVNVAPKHIRTHADGKWTNNLLALPRY